MTDATEQEWMSIRRGILDTLRTGKIGAPKFEAELVENNTRVLIRNSRGAVVKSLSYEEYKRLK